MKKLILTGLLSFCFFCITLTAQPGGFAGSSQRIGFGPKAMAMSNAFTAVTSQGAFVHYNPAFAALDLGYKQIDFSVSSMSFDRIHQGIGGTFALPPSAGLSVNLLRTGVENIDGRSLSGYPTGEFGTSEYQLLTAFGMRLSSKFNAGIGFKLNYANYNEDLNASSGVGIDLGFLYKINPNLNFAFAIQDMFSEHRWNSADLYGLTESRNVINKFPTRFKWGLAWQKEEYTLSLDYEIQSLTSEVVTEELFLENGRSTIITTVDELNTNAKQLRLGGYWKAHERIDVRAGYNFSDLEDSDSNGLSAGFSIHLPFDSFSPSIDYAFVMEPNRISNIHVFAVSFKL